MLLWCSQLPNSALPRMKRSVTWLNPHDVLPALLCLSDKHPSFNVALISQVRLSSANIRAALRCHCERRVLCTHVPGACSPEHITEWGKIIFAVAMEWGGTQCACSIAAEVTYELLLEIIKKYLFFFPLSLAPSLLDHFLAEQDLRPSSMAYLLASPGVFDSSPPSTGLSRVFYSRQQVWAIFGAYCWESCHSDSPQTWRLLWLYFSSLLNKTCSVTSSDC